MHVETMCRRLLVHCGECVQRQDIGYVQLGVKGTVVRSEVDEVVIGDEV